MSSSDMTLEQAQHYGQKLVPWVIDERDLVIINRTRREAIKQTGSCLKMSEGHSDRLHDIDEILRKRLWYAAEQGE